MKLNSICLIGAGLLLVAAWSCRKQSDVLMSYDHDEELVFDAADSSFADKFDILWNGLNQYYALWDYEEEQGLNWDAVYDKYYPKFQALDKRGVLDAVTDDELSALLYEFLSPLLDGHLYYSFKNHKTGTTVRCQPGVVRLSKRDDYQVVRSSYPNLNYYANPANGEVETDSDGNPLSIQYSTQPQDLLNIFTKTPGLGGQWLVDKVHELQALPSLTDLQAYQLQQLKDLSAAMTSMNGKSMAEAVSIYNSLQARYSFLEIPGFDYIDPAFAKSSGLAIKYALLKGNIAYLGFSSFDLTSYLEEARSERDFDLTRPETKRHVERVRQAWQSWFDSVQTLHKNGTLGGVIIDVRYNGGGNMNDSKYVVGSLVPAGGLHYGYQRFKRGPGRYDFSPVMPGIVLTMSDPHETITEPVAILVNCTSVSMSETSALCVKTLPKGTVIGKRTFGAICALVSNDAFSYNYSGMIGIDGVTCVFGHVPSMAAFTLDKELIESTGIAPDIEVDFDLDLYKASGRDTQLERALQFLRSGK